MSREIKFRGKTTCENHYLGKIIKKNQWIYGYYFAMDNKSYIISDDVQMVEDSYGDYIISGFEEVVPESVGQYTGLKDKNGVEIYEGDILKIGTEESEKGLVVFNDQCSFAVLLGKDDIGWDIFHTIGKFDCLKEYYSVLGNKFENPEILKGNFT